MLSKADIVFANGEMLRQSKNLYNSAYNLPSGVDFELYNYVFKNECEIPCEMKEISRPIIGYVGRITRKVDLDLLLQLVAERKGYSFVVIGPVRRDDKVTDKLNLLMQYSNFFYIEEKGAKQLPNYIKFFDVCLMTYVLNEHTKYGYPLKLHEYLAMGKPVVASGLDCFKEFSDFVKVAFLVDEWLKYIDECLVESNNRHLVEKRIKTASQHSWQKRVAKIEKLVIEKLFKEKS